MPASDDTWRFVVNGAAAILTYQSVTTARRPTVGKSEVTVSFTVNRLPPAGERADVQVKKVE